MRLQWHCNILSCGPAIIPSTMRSGCKYEFVKLFLVKILEYCIFMSCFLRFIYSDETNLGLRATERLHCMVHFFCCCLLLVWNLFKQKIWKGKKRGEHAALQIIPPSDVLREFCWPWCANTWKCWPKQQNLKLYKAKPKSQTNFRKHALLEPFRKQNVMCKTSQKTHSNRP